MRRPGRGGRAAYVEPPRLRGGRAASLVGTAAGYALLALGISVQVHAAVGLSPWDAFHQGVAERLGLSFGTAAILTGVVVVLISWLLGAPRQLGTIANMVVVGLLIDVFLGLVPTPDDAPLIARTAVLVVGIGITGLAFALYVAAGLGPGPRDGLLLQVSRRTHVRIGITRAAIEGLVLVLGVALGGTAGIGTVLGVVLMGPACEVGIRVLVLLRLARPSRALVA